MLTAHAPVYLRVKHNIFGISFCPARKLSFEFSPLSCALFCHTFKRDSCYKTFGKSFSDTHVAKVQYCRRMPFIHLRAQNIPGQHAVTDDRATSTSRPVPAALLSAPAKLPVSWRRRCHVYRQSRCNTGQSQLSPLLIHSITLHCPVECRQHSTYWYE